MRYGQCLAARFCGRRPSASRNLALLPCTGRIVERSQRGDGLVAAPRHLDLVACGKQVLKTFARPARNVAEADSRSERVPIAAGREMADDATISENGLIVKEKPFGVGELELQQAAREACLALAQHGLATEEVTEAAARFVGLYRKTKPRLEHVILIGDVMPEMAVGLLKTQRIHRQQSRGPQPTRPTCLKQNRKEMPRELARHVQFVAELADVADPMRPHVGHADFERA